MKHPHFESLGRFRIRAQIHQPATALNKARRISEGTDLDVVVHDA